MADEVLNLSELTKDAFMAGLLPTASMMILSWTMTLSAFSGNDAGNGSDSFEEYISAICGGLILAAVGSELFPLLETSDFMGASIGCVIGILLIFLLGAQDALFEEGEEDDSSSNNEPLERGYSFGGEEEMKVMTGAIFSSPQQVYQSLDNDQIGNGGSSAVDEQSSADGSEIGEQQEIHHRTQADQWVIAPETLEKQAKNLSGCAETKGLLKEKLLTMFNLVKAMNDKSTQLVSMSKVNHVRRSSSSKLSPYYATPSSPRSNSPRGHTSGGSGSGGSGGVGGVIRLSIAAAESLADSLDEDVHRLQYLVDHCRRQMEGSAANFEQQNDAAAATEEAVSELISVSRSKHLERSVQEMVISAEMILSAFEGDGHADRNKGVVSPDNLKIIYRLLHNMDKKLNNLHSTVDRAAFRYKRRSAKDLGPFPMKGSVIPLSLVAPVVVDCAVDGFLIGLSCSLSHRAGVILGLVTCVEMGALGAAFGLRIAKCTGNTWMARRLTITIPPLVMLTTCYLGAMGGSQASDYPVTMGISVGFGVTSLLQLACVELLGEAFRNENTGIANYALMFAGVWIVLALNRVVS
jgi:hypothetical protein